jgi:hypothetical protein
MLTGRTGRERGNIPGRSQKIINMRISISIFWGNYTGIFPAVDKGFRRKTIGAGFCSAVVILVAIILQKITSDDFYLSDFGFTYDFIIFVIIILMSFFAGEWLAYLADGKPTVVKATYVGLAAGVSTLAFTTAAYFLFIPILYGPVAFTSNVDYSTEAIIWFISTAACEISLFYIAIVPFSIAGSVAFDPLFLGDPRNSRNGLQLYLIMTLVAILVLSVLPVASAILQ